MVRPSVELTAAEVSHYLALLGLGSSGSPATRATRLQKHLAQRLCMCERQLNKKAARPLSIATCVKTVLHRRGLTMRKFRCNDGRITTKPRAPLIHGLRRRTVRTRSKKTRTKTKTRTRRAAPTQPRTAQPNPTPLKPKTHLTTPPYIAVPSPVKDTTPVKTQTHAPTPYIAVPSPAKDTTPVKTKTHLTTPPYIAVPSPVKDTTPVKTRSAIPTPTKTTTPPYIAVPDIGPDSDFVTPSSARTDSANFTSAQSHNA
jgi:hypothetical protein